jgi:hypothetical protein
MAEVYLLYLRVWYRIVRHTSSQFPKPKGEETGKARRILDPRVPLEFRGRRRHDQTFMLKAMGSCVRHRGYLHTWIQRIRNSKFARFTLWTCHNTIASRYRIVSYPRYIRTRVIPAPGSQNQNQNQRGGLRSVSGSPNSDDAAIESLCCK